LTHWTFTLLLALATSGCFLLPAPRSAYRPIHQAAQDGDAAAVAADLAADPRNLNLPDDAGLTPLALATLHCHTNVMALLLDHGARTDRTNNDGATPLHLAAQEDCPDGALLLLRHGASLNPTDNQGHTPLDRARLWHHDDMVQLLESHGATPGVP